MVDPRWIQIGVLSGLLAASLTTGDFAPTLTSVGLLLLSVQLCQWLCCRLVRQPFDWRSPLISALSLCILMRVGSYWTLGFVAVLAIGSKFVFRFHGKHFFNPTNFAIVALLVTGSGWVEHGQWNNTLAFAAVLLTVAVLLLSFARRWDISVAFLIMYGGLQLGYRFWLGDPVTLFWHQMTQTSLIIFTFFMISDPRSTPDTRSGRLVFAMLVACLAFYWQRWHFEPNALFYALFSVSLITPLLDVCLPGKRFHWQPDNTVSKPERASAQALAESGILR